MPKLRCVMEIKGKVHCLFEQTGTFKREFIRLGVPAIDYDIQNNFGETDNQVDIFKEIEKGYEGNPSIFDRMVKDDLIFAFFPCIYFSCVSQLNFTWGCRNYRNISVKDMTDKILERNKKRSYFYSIAIKMFALAKERNLRLIMENPWAINSYLKGNFIMPPAIIDNNRAERGDYFRKPTAYWFLNCSPSKGSCTREKGKIQSKTILHTKKSSIAGLCSMERSTISPDYAHNFICEYILGIIQGSREGYLFNED